MIKNMIIGILAGIILNNAIYSHNEIVFQVLFVIFVALAVVVVISEIECVIEERRKQRIRTERMRRQLKKIGGIRL